MNKSIQNALETMFATGSYSAEKTKVNEVKAAEAIIDKFSPWVSVEESATFLTVRLCMGQWAINQIKVREW